MAVPEVRVRGMATQQRDEGMMAAKKKVQTVTERMAQLSHVQEELMMFFEGNWLKNLPREDQLFEAFKAWAAADITLKVMEGIKKEGSLRETVRDS